MSYVTEEEYNWLGYDKEIKDMKTQLSKASMQINIMCYGRIDGRGFENLSEHQKKLIKEAVCVHAEFCNRYKDYLDSPLQSFSISKTSISFGDIGVLLNGVRTDKAVYEYLRGTGLMCRVI